MKRVIIVGGGISGLATAYYLKNLRGDLAITLLEERERPGGVIDTVRKDGFLVEGGPDSFIIQKPWALELCRELGMEGRLFAPEPANRRVYVLRRGRLLPLPAGMMLGAPADLGAFLASPLLSWKGKLRAGLDLVLPRGKTADEESLGAFLRRRLGDELVERIADPLLGGIHAAPADRLSLQATLPRLLEIERRHRSLILGLRREARSTRPDSPFRTLPGGMGELVEKLRGALEGIEIRTETRVEEIVPGKGILTKQEGLAAQAVVVAMPPPAASPLFTKSVPALAKALKAIPAVSTATISLAYRAPHPAVSLAATGFLIPRSEQRRILACTWSSRKFAGRAPEGHLLVRAYVGGDGGEEMMKSTDDVLAGIAREELAAIMGLREPPIFAVVHRWPKANPILEVGHAAKLARITQALEQCPGIFLTGGGYRGVGLPDCIRDARDTARQIAAEI